MANGKRQNKKEVVNPLHSKVGSLYVCFGPRGGSYELIGACFVLGLMDGEGLNGPERGAHCIQYIQAA
jgi:hypothetical protein